MKRIKTKLIIILLFAVFALFFSNDFGLIDIERTAIITAIAIDYDGKEYYATAEIAVPEASDSATQNQKTLISGKGATIGSAVKEIGDETGWYPQLSFCNLIILGNGFNDTNVITVLDYFSKTLRVQDSALVVYTDTESNQIISHDSPLDDVSSFAIQKLILKNLGFDQDTVRTNIKDFVTGYYSPAKWGIMPIVKVIPPIESDESQSGQSGQSGQFGESEQSGTGGESESSKEEQKKLFSAKRTALFLDGKKVGELDEDETAIYNLLTGKFTGSTIDLIGAGTDDSNVLLTVLDYSKEIKLTADNTGAVAKISVKVYGKISDTTAKKSDETQTKNTPLPLKVKEKAEQYIQEKISGIVQASVQTGVDVLKLKEKLYRRNFNRYSEYKDNLLDVVSFKISVEVQGQK